MEISWWMVRFVRYNMIWIERLVKSRTMLHKLLHSSRFHREITKSYIILINMILTTRLSEINTMQISLISCFCNGFFELFPCFLILMRDRRRHDRMVVGVTTTYAISAFHHWCCEFESRSGRGVQHYVITFVTDCRQVGGFLRFSSPIKLTATI